VTTVNDLLLAGLGGQDPSGPGLLLATTTSVGSTVAGQQICQVQIDGADTQCTAVCPDADGYFPTIGDRLLVQRHGSQVYVISVVIQQSPPTLNQVFSGTTGTTGILTVNHSLGRLPIGALLTPLTPVTAGASASIFNTCLPFGLTSTQLTIRALNATPTFLASTAVTFSALLW